MNFAWPIFQIFNSNFSVNFGTFTEWKFRFRLFQNNVLWVDVSVAGSRKYQIFFRAKLFFPTKKFSFHKNFNWSKFYNCRICNRPRHSTHSLLNSSWNPLNNRKSKKILNKSRFPDFPEIRIMLTGLTKIIREKWSS